MKRRKCTKKYVVVLIAMMAITLSGCSKTETVTNEDVAKLEAERDQLNEEILNTKIDNGLAKYVITFNIK